MSRQARVGLLVLAGILLFLVTLFAIANRSFLFSDTFSVKARYDQVAGLQPGAPVQFQGVNVGRVEAVRLPSEPNGPITVEMALQENTKPLINSNTQAQIKTQGLVGNQMIVLVNPANQQATDQRIEEGEFIPGVEPFDLYEITDQALAAVDTFATVAVEAQQIMQDIQAGEGTLGKMIYDPALYNSFVSTTQEAEQTLSGISRSAEQLVATAQEATVGVNSILQKVNQGDGTLAKLINDPAVFNSLLATTDTLRMMGSDVRNVIQNAENATAWASLGSYRFAELMEAAKHNWIFKRYFENRGYMEKAPFEVREEAIEESYQELQAERREVQRLKERLEERLQELNELQSAPAASDSLDQADDETASTSGPSQ